ncbi:MAG: hypothetical protein ACK4F9_02455 [Brevinematia bacterium]
MNKILLNIFLFPKIGNSMFFEISDVSVTNITSAPDSGIDIKAIFTMFSTSLGNREIDNNGIILSGFSV